MKLEDTSSEAAYEELVSRKWLFAWRFYLTIHLLFVVAMAVVTTSGHADYFDRGAWRDVAIPLAPVLYPVALFGFPMMYVPCHNSDSPGPGPRSRIALCRGSPGGVPSDAGAFLRSAACHSVECERVSRHRMRFASIEGAS